MSLPIIHEYPAKSAFDRSIDQPNGIKIDIMKDGTVYAWIPDDSVNCAPTPGFMSYTFESLEDYNKGEWTFKGRLHPRVHFMSGNGEKRWKNGDVYIGNFIKRSLNGEGIYRFADGRVYTGTFNYDRADGVGMVTWPDGHCFCGYFKDGDFDYTQTADFTFPDGELIRGRFDGRFKDFIDITKYYVWDMQAADKFQPDDDDDEDSRRRKKKAYTYWPEAKIIRIERTSSSEESSRDQEEISEEDEEPCDPFVTVRIPRTFTRAEDNVKENIVNE